MNRHNPARLTPAEAETALAESIALEDLGQVIDIRTRVRKGLEDTIDRVRQRCAQVADELSQDGEVTAVGSGQQHTAHGW